MSFSVRAILLLSFIYAAVSAFSSSGEPVQDGVFSFAAGMNDKPEAERRGTVLGRREDLAEIRVKALPRPWGPSRNARDISSLGTWSPEDLHQSAEKVQRNESVDTTVAETTNRSPVEMRIATGRQTDP